MDNNQKLKIKASTLYIVGAVLVFLALQELVIGPMMATESEEATYSQFRYGLASGDITDVIVEPENILYTLKAAGTDGASRKTVRVEDTDLVRELVAAGVKFEARQEKGTLIGTLLG